MMNPKIWHVLNKNCKKKGQRNRVNNSAQTWRSSGEGKCRPSLEEKENKMGEGKEGNHLPILGRKLIINKVRMKQ